jgi:hypothetical protein
MVERRIKEARFPTVKSLDSFKFAAAHMSEGPACAGAGCAPVGRDHSLSPADDRRRL